jgi:hypothetical protein
MTSVSLRAHRRQHGGQVNLGEVINEQVGGRGAAIHDDEMRLLQRGEDAVEFTAVVQVEKPGVGMKPLQRRVLVVESIATCAMPLSLRNWTKLTAKKLLPTPPLPLRMKSSRFMWFQV